MHINNKAKVQAILCCVLHSSLLVAQTTERTSSPQESSASTLGSLSARDSTSINNLPRTRIGLANGIRLGMEAVTPFESGFSRAMFATGLQFGQRNGRFEWSIEGYYTYQPYNASWISNAVKSMPATPFPANPEAQILDVNTGNRPAATTISLLASAKYSSYKAGDKFIGYIRAYIGTGYSQQGSDVVTVRYAPKPGQNARELMFNRRSFMIPFTGFVPGFEYRASNEWSIAVEGLGFHITPTDGSSINAFNIVVSRFF